VVASGTGAGQSRYVSDYVGATKVATVATWGTNPDTTSQVVVYASGDASVPDVNVLRVSGDSVAADNMESFFDGTGYAGTNNVIPSVTSVTSMTVTSIAANTITAASIASDAITAAKLAADVSTEIATAVLAAAAANPIDANVQEINDVTITGNGASPKFGV
jgi:hypothetical protein